MDRRFTIIFVLVQICQVFAENKTKDIEKLEKEKEALFKQINEAIDDSLTLLKNNNDTESKLGINYVTELKDQLKVINNSSDNIENLEAERRSNLRNDGNINLNIFDLAHPYKKDNNPEKIKVKTENRIKVQKTLDQWIKDRALEKKKIKDYKEKLKRHGQLEKCPRYGLGNLHKTKFRRREEGKGEGKATKLKLRKTKPKHPCCRKCCKKSYMGCL